MRFQTKRHPPTVTHDESVFIRELDQPISTLDKEDRLKQVKEKFFKRKAEFFIKKNLIKTSKKLNAMNGGKRNEEPVKF